MRYNTDKWTVSGASHIGFNHAARGENCQDAFAVYANHDIVVGVVCDGCGGTDVETPNGTIKGHTEVGSSLISNFILNWMIKNPNGSFSVLYDDLRFYIQRSVANESNSTSAINRYWLSTIVGFTIVNDYGFIFNIGDGVICIDNNTTVIDQRNTPHYFAYNCVLDPYLHGIPQSIIPTKFNIEFFNSSVTSKIMVATDGYINHSQDRLNRTRNNGVELPDNLHGQQWNTKGKTGLKRWLNVKYEQGYIDDDIAIVVAEKI